MFMVGKIDGREFTPYLAADGKPLIYETGADAAKAARELSQYGAKFQPRPIADDGAWKEREQARFDDGTYETLPEWFPDRPDHYVHHCLGGDRGKQIAYTESALKGVADRQTRIRVGAYLAKHFPDMSESDRCELSRKFLSEFDAGAVKFARTPDEIEHVYTNGPSSCMAYSARQYSSSIHPTRVYGAGDLAIAYLADSDGYATARTVCWPAKKRWVRCYGDEWRLESALRELGYSPGSLEGARLLAIEEDGGGFVAPYLDGYHGSPTDVEYNGEYLIIGGSIDCQTTNGIIDGEDRYSCDRCGERVDEDDTIYVEGAGETWCSHCAESHSFVCAETNECYPNRYRVTLEDGREVCRSWFDTHGSTCEGCNEHFADDQMSVDHSDYCESCAIEHFPEDARDASAPVERPYHCDSPDHLELPLVMPAPVPVPANGIEWAVGDLAEVTVQYLTFQPGAVGRIAYVDPNDRGGMSVRVDSGNGQLWWMQESWLRRPAVTAGMRVRAVSSNPLWNGRVGQIAETSFDALLLDASTVRYWIESSEAIAIAS